MAAFTVIDHEEATGDLTLWSKTSISQSYDHLLLKASLRSTKVAVYDTGYTMFLNGSVSSGDYSVITLDASTATPVSTIPALTSEITGPRIPAASAEAGTFAAATIWIPHYAQADNHKQLLITQVFPNSSADDDEWQVSMRAVLWTDPSIEEVTSVTMRRYDNDFAEFSSWTLYGITGA